MSMKDVTCAKQLYRDCIRLVGYISKQQVSSTAAATNGHATAMSEEIGGRKKVLMDQIRTAFRKNMSMYKKIDTIFNRATSLKSDIDFCLS